MGIEVVTVRPPRCLLINVTTGESIQCLFNPTQLTERVQVNWNRIAVPGLSHQVLQYQSTGNRQLAGIEFYVDRFFALHENDHADILDFRGFLRSLAVPPKAPEGVPVVAPPRTIFVWPTVMSIETVLTDLEFTYRQFGVNGNVLVYTATVTFEEILDMRVTSEERKK